MVTETISFENYPLDQKLKHYSFFINELVEDFMKAKNIDINSKTNYISFLLDYIHEIKNNKNKIIDLLIKEHKRNKDICEKILEEIITYSMNSCNPKYSSFLINQNLHTSLFKKNYNAQYKLSKQYIYEEALDLKNLLNNKIENYKKLFILSKLKSFIRKFKLKVGSGCVDYLFDELYHVILKYFLEIRDLKVVSKRKTLLPNEIHFYFKKNEFTKTLLMFKDIRVLDIIMNPKNNYEDLENSYKSVDHIDEEIFKNIKQIKNFKLLRIGKLKEISKLFFPRASKKSLILFEEYFKITMGIFIRDIKTLLDLSNIKTINKISLQIYFKNFDICKSMILNNKIDLSMMNENLKNYL